MKKLLNTLYVTTQGAYLSKEGETIAVKIDGKVRTHIPIHTLGGIVCFGVVGLSPKLMGFCAERNVTTSFLTENGYFLAKVQGPVSGNVLLRRQQYRWADDEQISATIARSILVGKIHNSRVVLRRAIRDHGDKVNEIVELEKEARTLKDAMRRLQRETTLNALRGIEGEAANAYFNVFDHLITTQKTDFVFRGRNRRPPMDRVNCLLSFLYTLLLHDIRSALETVGLDPQVGFLHRDRPGRPSLALDMMEEFRAFIADRLCLSMINLGQIRKNDFETTQAGPVLLKEEARKKVLVAYQNRKKDEIMHPFLREKMPIGLMFHIQSQLLARHIRGDLDGYPPFLWS